MFWIVGDMLFISILSVSHWSVHNVLSLYSCAERMSSAVYFVDIIHFIVCVLRLCVGDILLRHVILERPKSMMFHVFRSFCVTKHITDSEQVSNGVQYGQK